MRWSLSSSLLCTILATAFSASPAFAKDSSDITQFGHDVRIEADQTADQVTCFGCSVYVRGQVAGDITTFGGNIVLEDGGRIAGEVTSPAILPPSSRTMFPPKVVMSPATCPLT